MAKHFHIGCVITFIRCRINLSEGSQNYRKIIISYALIGMRI